MPAAWAKLAARSGARPVPGRDREGAGPPLNGRDAFEPAPTRHPGPCTPDQHARPETELIGALESGQIDYLAIYLSDARQHHFKYLDLPAQINLSDARYAKDYAQAAVKTANGVVTGVPTVYAITIPTNAAHPDWAASFVSFVLGGAGRKAMEEEGFGTVQPAYASDSGKVPPGVGPLVTAWPRS